MSRKLSLDQLRQTHGYKLIPAGKFSYPEVTLIMVNTLLKLEHVVVHEFHQLR